MNILKRCEYNKCKKYSLDTILLPCSSIVCKVHLDKILGEQFKCFVCKNQHEASDLTIGQLRDQIDEFEIILNDPESFIFEEIAKIRNKIDLKREILIHEINSRFDEMLANLLKYENECKQNLQQLTLINEQQKFYLAKLKSDMINLRTPGIKKIRIDNLLKDSNLLNHDLSKHLSDFKNNLMMNMKCDFNEMSTKFDQKLFGELIFSKAEFMDRNYSFKYSLILFPNQFRDLIKLCVFEPKAQFNLIYQASKDGFSAESFHLKCDSITNTLTLVKVKGNSNVFGGFCSVTWDEIHKYKNDAKAFIFSFINKENQPVIFNISKESSVNAIFCRPDYGPTFGGGHDIFISNNSNQNEQSYSNLSFSYLCNQLSYGSTKAKNFLAGSFHFATEEIEVFQVV